MKLLAKFTRTEQFEHNWQRLLVQGFLVLLTGFTFAFASVLKSEAVVLSAKLFSWLPVCGMIVLALGVLECLDALFAREMRDFIQRLHVGIMDVVVGAFIVLGISESVEKLSLMIAVYLLVRSLIRMILAYTLRLPHAVVTVVCGVTCITLGLMVWLGWPTMEGWFFAMCISIEIAFRGVVMILFAFLIKERNENRDVFLE